MLTDLALAVADGAQCISDIVALVDQPGSSVASDSTVRRLLERLDDQRLRQVAVARATARQTAWAQAAEATGQAFAPVTTAGREIAQLRTDLDATVMVAQREMRVSGAILADPDPDRGGSV